MWRKRVEQEKKTLEALLDILRQLEEINTKLEQ